MENKTEDIDALKNKTLDAAESLLSKLKKIMSLEPTPAPIFEQYEIDALKVLIEFHS